MRILEKIENYLNEGNVKDFIQKYKMKMGGSSLETAIGWIDGIGEISSKEKQSILKGILGGIGDKSNKANIAKENPWSQGILKSLK